MTFYKYGIVRRLSNYWQWSSFNADSMFVSSNQIVFKYDCDVLFGLICMLYRGLTSHKHFTNPMLIPSVARKQII